MTTRLYFCAVHNLNGMHYPCCGLAHLKECWPQTRTAISRGNAFDLSTCKGELARHIATAQQKREAGLQGARVQQVRKAKR